MFDDMHGLILALRRQFFERLHKTFYRHAVGYLDSVGSDKKTKRETSLPTETTIVLDKVSRGLVHQEIFHC